MSNGETKELAKQDPAALAGWERTATADGLVPSEVGGLSAVAREQSDIQAAIVSAKRFPRDETAAYTKIIKSCQRPSFAEGCTYSFPRGGAQISGPSVQLAREQARCWGNLRYGLRIVAETDDEVHIKGYALDVETNSLVEMEDRFRKKIQRKRGGKTIWIEPDERDLRELVCRRGAICVRNSILQLLPPDITDDAVRQARRTMEQAAKGEIQQDRAGAIRRMALAFRDLGVTTEMLKGYLKHDVESIDEKELAELRGVYKSMLDGNSRREEHFGAEVDKPKTDAEIRDQLGKAPEASVIAETRQKITELLAQIPDGTFMGASETLLSLLPDAYLTCDNAIRLNVLQGELQSCVGKLHEPPAAPEPPPEQEPAKEPAKGKGIGAGSALYAKIINAFASLDGDAKVKICEQWKFKNPDELSKWDNKDANDLLTAINDELATATK